MCVWTEWLAGAPSDLPLICSYLNDSVLHVTCTYLNDSDLRVMCTHLNGCDGLSILGCQEEHLSPPLLPLSLPLSLYSLISFPSSSLSFHFPLPFLAPLMCVMRDPYPFKHHPFQGGQFPHPFYLFLIGEMVGESEGLQLNNRAWHYDSPFPTHTRINRGEKTCFSIVT